MPVNTRSRAKRKESEVPTVVTKKPPPPSRKPKTSASKATTASVSSSLTSVSDGYNDPQQVENVHPKKKVLKSLPKKDCALMVSLLKQRMFDDDELPNLFMDLHDAIQKKLRAVKLPNQSDNPRAAAAKTPLMKKFLSRCPNIRDNVLMSTQRPSPIRETRESVEINNTPAGLDDVPRRKKKKKPISYVIPPKSPWAKQRVTRSRSKAKPAQLHFTTSTVSTCSSAYTDTEESQREALCVSTQSSTVGTTVVQMDNRMEIESKGKENGPVKNTVPTDQATKKRKPETNEHYSGGMKIPQTFDFEQESMGCAAKKRILDLPPSPPPKHKAMIILDRLSNKEIRTLCSSQSSKEIVPNSKQGAGDAEILVPKPQEFSTSVKLSKQESNDVSPHDNQMPAIEKLTIATDQHDHPTSSTRATANDTYNFPSNIKQNDTFTAKLTLGTTFYVGPADATFSIQATSSVKSGGDCNPSSSISNTTYNIQNDAVAEKVETSNKTHSPSVKLMKMNKSKSALGNTPTESQKPEDKKPSAQLARSASSNPDLLMQRKRDNIVGTSNKIEASGRTPLSSMSSAKFGDRAKTVRSPTNTVEKVSDGPRQVDKLTDFQKIKKLEEKQDKCLRTKEEMLQQKKAMHKKKNEEWKARIAKMKAEEEERKRVEEEKRKAEDAARKEAEKKEMEKKKRVDELARKEAEEKKEIEKKKRADELARKEAEEKKEMEKKRRADEWAKKEAEMQRLERVRQDELLSKVNKPPTSTFSVKAAVQALNVKAKAHMAYTQGIRNPTPLKLLPKHLSADKGTTSSCPDIVKKCGPSTLHQPGKLHVQVPGLLTKQISGSAIELETKARGSTESTISSSSSTTTTAAGSWRPLGKHVKSGVQMPPPPMFKQPPQPPPSSWRIKSPVQSKPFVPVNIPPPSSAPINDSFNDTFVTVANSTIDCGNRDTYDITIFDNIDEDMAHREGKYVPDWASDTNKLHLSLFLQQPDLIELMQTKCFPVKNIGFQLFPKSSGPRP